MFHKDTFRLIRKTFKRFVTIFLIVLIGVGFMVGLMSSAPTMRASVDKYFDDTNFMDVQLYSSYGFDDRDIDALKKSENIDSIFPTKFIDVLLKNDESTVVTRVQEIDSDINTFELIEGRMPQKRNEALALGSSSFGAYFKVGDKAEVYLEDEDLSESLEYTEYEIVGIVRTPQYMSSSREISTLNNISLSTVIYVDNDNFLNDYYTSVYLTFKGSKDFASFDDEYKDYIEESIALLDEIIDDQEEVRKKEIIEEITLEIQDGEKELNEEISKAQAEIDDGRKQLEDAYIQILVGEAQLESSEKQIETGRNEIEKNKDTIKDAEKQLKDAKKQIADQSDMTYDDAVTAIKSSYSIYNMVNSMLADPDSTPEATLTQNIAEKNAELDKLSAENSDLTDTNQNLRVEIIAKETEIKQLEDEISAIETENSQLETDISTLEEENKSLESDPANSDKIAQNNLKIAEYELKITENNLEITKKQAAIVSAKQIIEDNKSAIAKNEETIDANKTRIQELRSEIIELEGLKAAVGDETLEEIPPMIDEMYGGSVTAAYNGVLQIEDGEKELEFGKKQLASAEAEIEAGVSQIESAKKQLEDGRKEYEKGLKELEDGQEELDKEYENARIELDKAKQELSELPEAQWTVLDRDSHYSTAMFESNADQMQRIGDVFPMLFCLVAALVCMTTMKRLVDEQRSQIGVFSAIGFSNGKIIGKYVIYALSASLLGSGIGIPIGVLSLPWVIYYCWTLMYDLPPMELYMPLYIAVIGVSLFTFLMVWVTFTVVRNVLKECPSQLMRPKAPRTAKKVFLENIPFIWKRMSFTSKVTARNIIRYKSRFFMTVVGVAGCTSLLVLGFAIKGSISQVISRQYGDILHYDITMTLEENSHLDNVYEELMDDYNVEYAVPYMTYSAMAYSDDEEKAINVYVMDDRDIYDVIDLKSRRTKEKLSIRDGVVISEKYAKLCNIQAGDNIVVESSSGIKKEVEVSGICEMYTQHFMFIGEDYYEDIFDETVYCENIAVDCADSALLIRDYNDTEGVKSIEDFSGTVATFSNMLDSLDIIVIVIIIAAGSLALVVIMNLTEVNISERIREIATLKVLGFNNREVYAYIFKEVFILSLIGMVIGLPLGKLELIFVMDIIEMEMVMFSTVIEPSSYIFGFGIIMLFTTLVILLMRKTLKNVQMVESLKSVE